MGLDVDGARPTAVVDDAGPRVLPVGTVQFVDTAPTSGRAQLVDPAQGVPRYRAGRAVASADAHLAGVVEADQLDVRRVPEPGAQRAVASRRRGGAWADRRADGSGVQRSRIDRGAARGPRRHPARRRGHEQGRVAAQPRRRLGCQRADPGRPPTRWSTARASTTPGSRSPGSDARPAVQAQGRPPGSVDHSWASACTARGGRETDGEQSTAAGGCGDGSRPARLDRRVRAATSRRRRRRSASRRSRPHRSPAW